MSTTKATGSGKKKGQGTRSRPSRDQDKEIGAPMVERPSRVSIAARVGLVALVLVVTLGGVGAAAFSGPSSPSSSTLVGVDATATAAAAITVPTATAIAPGRRHAAAGVVSLAQATGGTALDVAPGAFGPNRFLLSLPGGVRATDRARVSLSLYMVDMPMGTTVLPANPVGKGRYQAMGRLNMPGHWRIMARVTGAGLPGGGIERVFHLTAPARTNGTVPAPLPIIGGMASVAADAALIAPAAVRWTGLPYHAVVSFLGNGNLYVPGDASLVRVGDLNHSVTRAPDGTAWVADYNGGRVVQIDPRDGHTLGAVRTGLAPVHIAFSHDGSRAYVSDFLSGDVAVVDTHTHRKLATIPVGLYPHGLALSPDGGELWVPCSYGGGIWVIDTHTNQVKTSVGIKGTIYTIGPRGTVPHAVAFSPDGRTAYMTDAGPGDLVVIDHRSGRIRARVAIHTGSAMLAVQLDGRRIYVTGQGGSVLTVVDAASLRVVARVPVGGAPHGLAFTPDGRLLYVASNTDNHVAIVSVAGGAYRVIATVPVPGQADEVALVTANAPR